MNERLKLFQLLLFICGFSSSQLCGQEFLPDEFKSIELRRSGSRNYSDIDGSPYYTDKFMESVVYLKNGNYSMLNLRYDLFQDQMEFMKENKIKPDDIESLHRLVSFLNNN